MADINMVCEACREEIFAVFEAAPRPSEVIAGDLYVTDCCFVRDEIRFLNSGRLIFRPQTSTQEYCREYYVICRRLVIVDGGKPIQFGPCGHEDPGSAYKGHNVITWEDRLSAAAEGPFPNPPAALKGDPDWDVNQWLNEGQGNNGADGGDGQAGAAGAPGSNGQSGPNFTLVALEVEFLGLNAHLTVDFDGRVGGRGGRGQDGGDGGDGMGGRNGDSDTTWPGIGCDRQPGHGGDGGDGGDGGPGGPGGRGGDAGDVTIISTHDNITSGAFVGGDISYVNDGGNEGAGGLGGFGGGKSALGIAGRGGKPGFKTSECDAASSGDDGNLGFPPPGIGPGSQINQGPVGAPGNSGSIDFQEITENECSVIMPLPIVVDAVTPAIYCRGFSSAANNLSGTITGQNLAQVTAVDVSLGGVTATIQQLTSSDTQLDLRFDIAGNSDLGPGDLILHRVFGSSETLSGAIEVQRFEVLSVSPNSGARGTMVSVTITGQCFDPDAAIQQVNVSGVGVSVQGVVVLDENTIQCTFDIAQLAATSARDVTVITGTLSHTLVDGFTVTS